MNLDQTRAYLEGLERSAAKLALPPACPKCNSNRTMLAGHNPDGARVFYCANCCHNFQQLALFPMPECTTPATLTLTPSEGPAPRQASLFSPLTSGQEE